VAVRVWSAKGAKGGRKARRGFVLSSPFVAFVARSTGAEEGEEATWERHLALLRSRFSPVHDLDDTRQARHGVYYAKKKPPTLAAIQALPGI